MSEGAIFGHMNEELSSMFDAEYRRIVKEKRDASTLYKRALYFFWDFVSFFISIVYHSITAIVRAMRDAGKQYHHFLQRMIRREKNFMVHYLLYVCYVFWPVAVIIPPAGILVVITLVCVVVDQFLYPEFPINVKFSEVANADLSMDRKSALLFEAAIYQIDNEMKSPTGWTVNDLSKSPTKFFDNKVNRQKGVISAARILVPTMSAIFTNLGTGSKENEETRRGGKLLNSDEEKWNWYMGDAEDNLSEGIALVKKYTTEAYASNGSEMANVNPNDILELINVIIKDVLREPLGRLQEQEKPLTFAELDDEVYYAQGTAIVVRDVLVALRSTYPNIMIKGSTDNLNLAIQKLSQMADDNPYCVYSLMELGDTRAIFATFYNSALEQLKVVANSIRV